MKDEIVKEALGLIFKGIDLLNSSYPSRNFTIDGRLVGDIGEGIAGRDYQLVLDETSRAVHDAVCEITGKNVQIKATFKDSLTFTRVPEMYLGLKLHTDGRYEEIYNGPGDIIRNEWSHRKGVGEKQLSFPIKRLKGLSASLEPNQRILKRETS